MSDLVYAAIVIVIIWGGIFFYLVGLDRRVRRLETRATSPAASETGGSTVVSRTMAEDAADGGSTDDRNAAAEDDGPAGESTAEGPERESG